MCVCVCVCVCLCGGRAKGRDKRVAGGRKERASVYVCMSLRTSEGCGTLGDVKDTYIYKDGLWLVCVNNPRRLAVFT